MLSGLVSTAVMRLMASCSPRERTRSDQRPLCRKLNCVVKRVDRSSGKDDLDPSDRGSAGESYSLCGVR